MCWIHCFAEFVGWLFLGNLIGQGFKNWKSDRDWRKKTWKDGTK